MIFLWTILALSKFPARCAEYTCPEMCSCQALTVTTDCSGNELDNLPEGIYLQVVNLDLSRNSFKTVPSLAPYQDLRLLNLSDNRLTAVTKNSLRGLEQLKVLDLSGNLFSQWSDFSRLAFTGMKNLEELILDDNRLGNFPEMYLPLNVANLKILRANNCSIGDVHGDILQPLPSLEEFYMGSNPISGLRAQIKSKTLRILDLSGCNLRIINDDVLFELPNLYKLVLTKNYELTRFGGNSNSLKVLYLNYCYLNSIPKGNFPNLTILTMQGNHLRQLTSDCFENMTKLEILDVSNNAVSRIDSGTFVALSNVYLVNLSYNTISSLDPKALSQNFKLRKLFLSHNYFKTIPHLDVESLKYLDMSSCEIDRLNRDCLSLLTSIDEINLSRNFISRLPEGIISDTLRTLDLSHCYLSSVSNETFSEMPLLRNLNLAGNRLTSNVRPSYFPQVTYIRLDDNPWRCDCGPTLRELYEWLVFLNVNPSRLRCQSPENLEGLIWSTACDKTWYPENNRRDTLWVYSLALVCTMAVTFCVIFAIRRAYQQKEQRLREMEEQEREEARERLRRMRQQQQEARETENRNAPDPRELQRPPSYTEALLMSSSLNSLTGSRQSLNSRGKKKRRRKRRKEKGESSGEERSGRGEDGERVSDGEQPRALESDF